jgi:hypothetical protein
LFKTRQAASFCLSDEVVFFIIFWCPSYFLLAALPNFQKALLVELHMMAARLETTQKEVTYGNGR